MQKGSFGPRALLVRDRVPVTDLVDVDRYGRGICPVHGGQRGAFKVQDGKWTCFRCGLYGDVIDLYALIHDIPIAEALAALEAKYGIKGDPGILRAIESRQSREKALKQAERRKLRIELCDIRLALLRIEDARARIGDFVRNLLSFDEANELAKLADYEAKLLARYEELQGVLPIWKLDDGTDDDVAS